MTKVTLDMNTFKALASDTRLDILKALDGKRMSLNDISRKTKLNKATLHEHLAKLNEAGLVKKKEREGHKWVYYKLTWKGECLLHPENTRIVVMFSVTFLSIFVAVMFFVSFAQPIIVGMAETYGDTTYLYEVEEEGNSLFTRPSEQFHSSSLDYGDIFYIGSVNATNQTVEDISLYFQMNAAPKNAIGQIYDEDDIQWYSKDRIRIAPTQSVLMYVVDSPYAMSHENRTDNETNGGKSNDTDGNLTDEYTGSGSLNYGEYTPAIPEMIAVVQDPTSLYIGVSCILFAVLLFTASTWRLIKNRKQKF